LYFNFFSASFCTILLPAGITTTTTTTITTTTTTTTTITTTTTTTTSTTTTTTTTTYSTEQSPSWEDDQCLQLVKKFPAFYGTRRFFIVLTSACHPSLSWANSLQSPRPAPTSSRSILILSSHLRLGLPNDYYYYYYYYYYIFISSGFCKTLYIHIFITFVGINIPVRFRISKPMPQRIFYFLCV
jgi:hypothetical protein